MHVCVSVAAWADRWGWARSTGSCFVLQAAQLQAQEAEASVKALRAQADQARQQAAEQQAQLEAQLAAVKQELQRTTTAHEVQVGRVDSSRGAKLCIRMTYKFQVQL